MVFMMLVLLVLLRNTQRVKNTFVMNNDVAGHIFANFILLSEFSALTLVLRMTPMMTLRIFCIIA